MRKEQAEVYKNIEEETFVRFVEYAYTGDYSVPQALPFSVVNGSHDSSEAEPQTPLEDDVPAEMPDYTEEAPEFTPIEEASEETTEPPSDLYWGSFGGSKKKKKNMRKRLLDLNTWQEEVPASEAEPACEEAPHDEAEFVVIHENGMVHNKQETKKEILWSSFIREAHPKVIPPWEPDTSAVGDLDFAPVLLSHAKLYAFSDWFELYDLRQLVLEKLRLTLSRFDLVSERSDAVAQLLRYAYDSTFTKIKSSDEDPNHLRELVLDYVTCHVESLVQDRLFLDILQEQGPLAKDLVQKLLLRVD